MDSPIFPASTEKNPTSPEPNLLNLPTHVLENIVGFLDLNSLKTLRLVCHSTNSLVCESSFYDKVQIYIGDKERLNQVILSHHPWRNFILFLEDRQNLELKLQFLEHFRSTLRKLEVRGVISTSAGILSFLGPELESLHFNMRSGYEDGDVWNSALEVSQTPMEWFLHLRDLNLQISGIFDSFAASMRKVTEVFMENAPNLQSVKFPVVFPVSTSDGEFSASGANDECGRPLIEFLERKVAKAPAGGSPHSMNIAIDWCSTRGDFTGPNSDDPISPFPLTTSVLVQLAKLCEGIGGRLYNVPSTAFPRYGAATSQEMESLDKSVASVYAVNHELHDLTTLFIPHHASLELVIGSTHLDSYSLLPQLNLPSSMNISGIAIDYETHGNDNSDIAIANRSMISNELFRKSREGLTKLQVVTQMIDHDWIPNLNNSSPNLIELLIRIPKWFYSSTALPLPNHDFIPLTDMRILKFSRMFGRKTVKKAAEKLRKPDVFFHRPMRANALSDGDGV